jgi:hypothetical protein
MKPYKIVAYEPGAAHVYDRESGEKIGFLLADFYGYWEAGGKPFDVVGPLFRYRDEAAERLWDAWKRRTRYGRTGERDELLEFFKTYIDVRLWEVRHDETVRDNP